MSFKPALLSGEITLPELFRWGAKKGFDWVEVRDFELNFSEADLRSIKTDAEGCGLRVHYAWDSTSVCNVEDCERFFRGIRNAAFFGEVTCSRVVIAPEKMDAANGKVGYSAGEFQTLEKQIRSYIAYAETLGVTLVFENSLEPLDGFEAFLEAVPAMQMTLDTANTFNDANTGEQLEWSRFRDFVLRRKDQIPYVHLKSSLNGQTCPDLLENGDVPLVELLPTLNSSAWLCVELPADDSLESCFRRLEEGAELVHRCFV